jgi:Tol biopolymer transport system component
MTRSHEAAAGRAGPATVALALSTLLATACVGAIGREELPEDPIAFVYYDAETTRKRSENIAEGMRKESGESVSQPGRGVAEVGEMARFIRDTVGVRVDDPQFQGRLALLDPRTRAVTMVEGARKGAVPQDWSRDHKRLLFSQVVHGGRPQLFELDVETGQVGPMTHGRGAHPEGCYGPKGSVVYTSIDTSRDGRRARIMLYDPLEKHPRQLSSAGLAYFPTCAADSGMVAYSTIPPNGGPQQIVIQSLEPDAEPRVLSTGKEPAFSPDGSLIAFSARSHGDWVLWRIRPDGKGRKSLGHGGFDEHRPNLSRDNRLVVYVADTITNQRLFLRRIDGSGDRLFFSGGDGDRPIW